MPKKPSRKVGKINVDKHALMRYLRFAEDTLGLPKINHDPEIEYISNRESRLRRTGGYVDPHKTKLNFPRKASQTAVFHESVHYVMMEHALLFGTLEDGVDFYGRVIDETVAELATAKVFGQKRLGNEENDYLELKPENDKLEETLEQFGKDDNTAQVLKRLGDVEYMPFELAHIEREIEQKYLETKSVKVIKDDIQAFMRRIKSYYGPGFAPILYGTVERIASYNAKYMIKSGATAAELVRGLTIDRDNGKNPTEIYFKEVVERLKPLRSMDNSGN